MRSEERSVAAWRPARPGRRERESALLHRRKIYRMRRVELKFSTSNPGARHFLGTNILFYSSLIFL
eukprot:scaffold8311_cov71-Phaeocystis_antarctica.AAC.1